MISSLCRSCPSAASSKCLKGQPPLLPHGGINSCSVTKDSNKHNFSTINSTLLTCILTLINNTALYHFGQVLLKVQLSKQIAPFETDLDKPEVKHSNEPCSWPGSPLGHTGGECCRCTASPSPPTWDHTHSEGHHGVPCCIGASRTEGLLVQASRSLLKTMSAEP